MTRIVIRSTNQQTRTMPATNNDAAGQKMMKQSSIGSMNSSDSPNNWANFESSETSTPSCCCHDNNNNQSSSSSTFVVFETTSWYSWILGTRTGRSSTTTAAVAPLPSTSTDDDDDDDDDGWTSRLLPLQQQQHQPQKTIPSLPSSSKKTPLLRRNPRDNVNNSHYSLYRTTTTRYQFYQAAYVANNNNNNNASSYDNNNNNNNSGEHLSNEEWIFQRRRRERRIRRRYQQEVEHMLGIHQVFRSNLDDMNEWDRARQRVDQHRFMQRLVADGQILLANTAATGGAVYDDGENIDDPNESHNQQNQNQPNVDQHEDNVETIVTLEQISEEQPTTEIEHQQQQQQQQQQTQRPRHRSRARRIPVTNQARRDRFLHWSSSAIQLSLDLVLIPWRTVFRSDDDSMNDENHQNPSINTNHSIRESIPSESERSSLEEDLWASTRGWRQHQAGAEYEDDDDSYEDDDDGSHRSGGTQYWSTGTAMESDYEDSINEDDNIDNEDLNTHVDDDDEDEEEHWENDLATQFPVTEEEDPHQYAFLPTPEDPLFPDDPFEGPY